MKGAFEQPRTILTTITKTVSFEYVSTLPKDTSLARQVHRERTDMKIPESLSEIAIPMELQNTLRCQKLLAYDSGSDDTDRLQLLKKTWTYLKSTQLGMQMAHSKAVQVYFIRFTQCME